VSEKVVVGVDLGGTNLTAGVVTEDGRVVSKAKVSTHAEEGPDAVLGRIAEAIEKVIADSGLGRDGVEAAGVGVPGPLDWQSGVVFTPPNLPGWKDVPVAAILTEQLGITTYIENDANSAGYGENWAGAGRSVKDLIALTLGTGIGGAIILNNKLWRGIDGTAGEIGHMIMEIDGRPCNCGSKGCIERYGSATGIVITAREMIATGKKTDLVDMVDGDLDKLTSKTIFDACQNGDELARDVFTKTGRTIGMGLVTLANLLNPEMFVICGGVIDAGDVLFDPMRQTLLDLAFEQPGHRAQVVPAELGDDAGFIGAAGVALQRIREDLMGNMDLVNSPL
jgi:glucokinase